jgi:hypothetical protein
MAAHCTAQERQAPQHVAAGIPGHAAVYADGLHPLIWAITALSTITAVAIGLLHRAKLKSEVLEPLEEGAIAGV